MPNFDVKDRAPARFPGDFQIDSVAPYAPNEEEKQYLATVQQQIDALANDTAADSVAKLRDTLRAARRDWRSLTASKLRIEAENLASGRADTKSVAERTAAIQVEYKSGTPDIAIEKASPERFQGEFTVNCVGFTRDEAEQAYLDRLKALVDYLAEDQAAEENAKYSDAVLAARQEQRKSAVEELRKDAGYWKEGLKSWTAANNVLVIRGSYKALRDRLNQPLFAVSVIRDEGDDKGLAVDLQIIVQRDLPAPNDMASPDKQDLFVQINNTCAIIRTVCQQIRDGANSWLRQKFGDVDVERDKRARRLLDEYINKLAGIGRLGLEGPHTSLAKLALTSLKSEFAAREAGRIKNRYVRRLGVWAAVFAFAFLVVYVVIRINVCSGVPAPKPNPCAVSWVWWDAHKTFLLAAAGAAIGTWVSFAIRRLDLPFEELSMLEEASLDPPFRIIFVVALTVTVCLLFWTGTINIEIGSLKTGPDTFKAAGSIALLVGLFCGLSERALATAISGRAATFVRGVAGGG